MRKTGRGVGPGGFSDGVCWHHAALPTPVSAGSGSKDSLNPYSGVPLAVQKKDTRAGRNRKFPAKCWRIDRNGVESGRVRATCDPALR